MAFFILPCYQHDNLISAPRALARWTISVEDWWQWQYEKGHVLIYLSHILPGQITCYCPRKILLPRRQITRRILCFYHTCKFGVISVKYVIMKGNDRLFGNDFNRIFKEGCKLNAHWYKMGIAKKNYLICVSTGNNSTCVCSEWGERVRLRTSDQ